MAERFLSMVDQVVPKLGDYWWSIMEKQYFTEFSKREPYVFSQIMQKAFLAVVDADFSDETGWRVEVERMGPFPIKWALEEPVRGTRL